MVNDSLMIPLMYMSIYIYNKFRLMIKVCVFFKGSIGMKIQISVISLIMSYSDWLGPTI